jgi:aryl-alcohol dehydrogenase-like predicted oxidoreductase
VKHFKDLEIGGYRAMDELRNAGLIKAIGLGVNENKVCMDALAIGDWDRVFCTFAVVGVVEFLLRKKKVIGES